MSVIERRMVSVDLTIASGATASDAVDISNFAFGSVEIPTTTDALTLQVSNDGSTWAAVTDSTGTNKATYASGDGLRLLHTEAFHFKKIRFNSGSSEAAKRTIPCTFKG